MRIKRIRFQLDHRKCNIGTMVRHSFAIGQQIIKHKTLIQRTDALFDTINMMQLHLIAQSIHKLLKRLHPIRAL